MRIHTHFLQSVTDHISVRPSLNLQLRQSIFGGVSYPWLVSEHSTSPQLSSLSKSDTTFLSRLLSESEYSCCLLRPFRL